MDNLPLDTGPPEGAMEWLWWVPQYKPQTIAVSIEDGEKPLPTFGATYRCNGCQVTWVVRVTEKQPSPRSNCFCCGKFRWRN